MRGILFLAVLMSAGAARSEPPPTGAVFTVAMPTLAASGRSCPVAAFPSPGAAGLYDWTGCGMTVRRADQASATAQFAQFLPDGEELTSSTIAPVPTTIPLAGFLARFTPAEIAAVQTANPALSILLAAGVATNGGLVDTTNIDLVAALAQLPESVLSAARRAQILDLAQKSP